jgi:hypothetical protein
MSLSAPAEDSIQMVEMIPSKGGTVTVQPRTAMTANEIEPAEERRRPSRL